MLFYFLSIFGRINHASSQHGAYIIDSSQTLNRPQAIMNSREDHYLIGKCIPSFIKIKLPNELRISTLEIQNCEWLSSFVKKIELIGNANVKIGTYYIKTTRDKVTIEIDCKHYVSELTINFLEFYGVHENFTITHLRIYGNTLLEDMVTMSKEKIVNALQLKGENHATLDKVSEAVTKEEIGAKDDDIKPKIVIGILLGFFVALTSKKIYDKLKL